MDRQTFEQIDRIELKIDILLRKLAPEALVNDKEAKK